MAALVYLFRCTRPVYTEAMIYGQLVSFNCCQEQTERLASAPCRPTTGSQTAGLSKALELHLCHQKCEIMLLTGTGSCELPSVSVRYGPFPYNVLSQSLRPSQVL